MFRSMKPSVLVVLAIAGLAAGAQSAWAAETKYDVKLDGAAGVPPIMTKGTGECVATYDSDTKTLSWTITYSGLTGPATAAHFHGPASTTANAPPVVPITGSLASPIKGSAVLTDAQAKDLMAGLWYFNLHTAANPAGEIRGQVVAP